MKAPLLLKAIVDKSLYIAKGEVTELGSDYVVAPMSRVVEYFPLCDDFGPFRLCEIVKFYEFIQEVNAISPKRKIVLHVDEGNRRAFTNAVFLLGSYLMLKYKYSASAVVKCFAWTDKSHIELYRDASYTKPDFGLSPLDCWRALERAMQLKWIAEPLKGTFGKYDICEYEHYDDPTNADMHVVVPGKFVAFKGPRDLQGMEYVDDNRGFREFSPEYYVDIFKAFNVTAVIRLNEPHYDGHVFSDHGIDHFDLEFEDCTPPQDEVVRTFLRIVDASRGLVAVHCKGGIGRTGTLIALYMMRSLGFKAREAIAWLRLVRPGSVIGKQQSYLCRMEASLAKVVRTVSTSHAVRRSASEVCSRAWSGGSKQSDRKGTDDRDLVSASMRFVGIFRPPGTVRSSSSDSVSSVARDAVTPTFASFPTIRAEITDTGASSEAAEVAMQVSEGMQRRAVNRIRRSAMTSMYF